MKRSRSLLAALASLFLLLAPGCATLVLGPGDPGPDLDSGVIGTIRSLRPSAAGYGPDVGLAATASNDLAKSYDVVIDRTDFSLVRGRDVYVAGLVDRRAPEAAVRPENAYIAARMAERVVASKGRLHVARDGAELFLIPWVQRTGGETTSREYRMYGYPLYTHEEDHRSATIAAMVYDPAKRTVTFLEMDTTWQVQIDTYLLGFIPIRWFLEF